MTDEQKYNEVLKELGAILKDKNETISLQRWQIADLTAKLEAAENENKRLKENNPAAAIKDGRGQEKKGVTE